MAIEVLVDDNYRYMDNSYRRSQGEFDTVEAALVAAKELVDGYLKQAHSPGMSAEALYSSYKMSGEDAFMWAPPLPSRLGGTPRPAAPRFAALPDTGSGRKQWSAAPARTNPAGIRQMKTIEHSAAIAVYALSRPSRI